MPQLESTVLTLQDLNRQVEEASQVRAQVAREFVFLGSPVESPTARDIHRALHDFTLNEPPPPPQPPPLPETFNFQSGPIDFADAPVGGWANITIYKNGNYEFWGHFHDSGAPSYDAGIVWVIVANDGTAFTFGRKVHLNGTFESGSRDGDWDDSGNNPDIAQHWSALAAGYHWRWSANLNWDWQILVKQVQDALKTAGTIIQGVVTVVAIF
jgi:hypothetical protein